MLSFKMSESDEPVNFLYINTLSIFKTYILALYKVVLLKIVSWYTAIMDCTITVQNQSSYLPKSANVETDL